MEVTDASQMTSSKPWSWVEFRDQPKSSFSYEEGQQDGISHSLHPSPTLTRLIKRSGLATSAVQSSTYV